jgi:hypothetical protein
MTDAMYGNECDIDIWYKDNNTPWIDYLNRSVDKRVKYYILHKAINGDDYLYSHGAGNEVFNFRSMQFEANLQINTATAFKSYPSDYERPVFGFINKISSGFHSETRVVNGKEYYNQLMLLNANDANVVNKKVLSNPWPDNGFSIPGVQGTDTPQKYYNMYGNFAGNILYVDIKLKNFKDWGDIQNGSSDLPVLEITVPVTIKNGNNTLSTQNLKFAMLPDNVPDDPSKGYNWGYYSMDYIGSDLPDYSWELREISRRMKPAAVLNNQYQTSEKFVITTKMLPPTNENMILRAAIIIGDKFDNTHKPFFLADYPKFNNSNINLDFNNLTNKGNNNQIHTINDIAKLGIDVVYKGNANIAIDWIRFETPHTQKILSGKHDPLIKTEINKALNSQDMNLANNTPNKPKLFRLVSDVEHGVDAWGGLKYIRELIGDIFTSEIGPKYSEQFCYYVNPAEQWLGLYKINNNINAPYLKQGYANFGTSNNYTEAASLNISGGAYSALYSPTYNSSSNFNSNEKKYTALRGSFYETHCPQSPSKALYDYQSASLSANTTTYKTNYYDGIRYTGQKNWPFQAFYETALNNYYTSQYPQTNYSNTDPHAFEFLGTESHFVDNVKNWWAQSFVHSDIKSINGYSVIGEKRPLTAEEFRLFAMNPIIMGAKGIIFDGLNNADIFPKMMIAQPNHSTSDVLDHNFVLSSQWGSDYLYDELKYNFLTNPYNRLPLDNVFPPREGTRLVPSAVNLQGISGYMGLKYTTNQENHVYFGHRSLRWETYKLNFYLSNIENLLMQYKFNGWYGKGFGIIKNNSNDLARIIPGVNSSAESVRIKSYRIGGYSSAQPRPEPLPSSTGITSNTSPTTFDQVTPEPFDSLFVDVSSLIPASSNSITDANTFILCVQNRRTDPLFQNNYGSDLYSSIIYDNNQVPYKLSEHFDHSGTDPISTYNIEFIPNADLEVGIIKSNNLMYANSYWKKFGARMIRIPFNKSVSINNNNYNVTYEISELGNTSPELNNSALPWGNTILYPKRRDVTVLTPTSASNLDIFLQPGQAKLYKVTLVNKVLKLNSFGKVNNNSEYSFLDSNLNISHEPVSFLGNVNFQMKSYKNIMPQYTKAELINISTDKNYPEDIIPIDVEILDSTIDAQIMLNKEAPELIGNSQTPTTNSISCYIKHMYTNYSANLCAIGYNSDKKFQVKIRYVAQQDTSFKTYEKTIWIGQDMSYKGDPNTNDASYSSNISDLTVSPNPANSYFKLEFFTYEESPVKINLLDNLGAVVSPEINMNSMKGLNTIDFNCSQLTTGSYTVMINDGVKNYYKRISIVK